MYSIEEKTGKNCPEKFTLNTRHSCPKCWTKRKKKKEKRLVEEQRLAIIASFSFNECSSTARTSVIGLFSVVGTR